MQKYFSVNFRVTFSSKAPSENDFYRVLHYIAIFAKLWQSLACSSLGMQKNQKHATQLWVHDYTLMTEQDHNKILATLMYIAGRYQIRAKM